MSVKHWFAGDPIDRRRRVDVGDAQVVVHHLGGDGPPLLLLHAAGFHGRCWLPAAATLSTRWTVWALDQRGHGASAPFSDGRYDDWDRFARDALVVVDALGPQGWSAFGHSFGGAVALLAEQRSPGTFGRIYCYEPIVPVAPSGARNPRADAARRRRETFPSREVARERYAAKAPFDRFDPQALDAYVRDGFVRDPAGGVRLACPRAVEASVYDGADLHGAHDRLSDMRSLVTVAGGERRPDRTSCLVEEVANRLPAAAVERFDGLSHYGPFEDPVRVAGAAAAFLAR